VSGKRAVGALLPVFVLSTALMLTGCGRKEKSASGSKPYEAPEYLKSPPTFSPVPIGSKELVATPPPGELQGTLLLRLASEPGAVIFYDYKDPGETPDTGSMLELKENLHLLPPVSVWAVAVVGGEAGPVRRFDYTLAKELFDPAGTITMSRLPDASFKPVVLKSSIEFVRYGADADAVRNQLKSKPDGTTAGWPGSGRYMLTDGLYDVPDFMGHVDISFTQVNLSAEKIELLLSLRAKPKTGDGTVYGFDIGDSGINFASFGKGTKFHYRVELSKGTLAVVDKGTSEPLAVSAGSVAAAADAVEFSVALSDLPLLTGLKNVLIRPFAYDLNEGVLISDRLEPFVVRTEFAVDRATVDGGGSRSWDINFLMDPAIKPEALSGKYLSMSGPLIDDLEKMNRIPFYSRGSLQLFFVDKEENGYAGLNTSDRGMLTTLGQQTSLLSKSQLLAHEFAHYQNARNSGILERWIQEGMSEWTAERYLYRHFPKRAVYKFMRRLRYDRYFEVTGGKADDFPLVNWGADASSVGYEKSLMFTNLLEKAIGHDNLLRIYQIGVNAQMKTEDLKRYAEHLSGKDLTELFNFWAFDGPLAPEWHPVTLFRDADGDGLMGIDEISLGTNATLSDTDADGYPDGEEYFRNMNPAVSLIDPDGALAGENTAVLVSSNDKDTMALARIGGERGAAFTWSFVPDDAAPAEPYVHPELFRPPYLLSVQSKKAGAAGEVRQLQRDLYVGGSKKSLTHAADHILPPTPQAAKNYLTGITRQDGLLLELTDNPNDLPDFIGSLDIVSVSASESDQYLDFTVRTRLAPDPFGQFGDLVFSFDEIDWSPSGPENRRLNALTLNAGAPFWHTVKGNIESAALINSGVETTYGTDLKVRVNKSMLAGWLAADGERLVCISSNIEIEHGNKFRDRAGCLVFAHPGFTTASASHSDLFGLTDHQVQVFWNTSAATAPRFDNALQIGLSAIHAFEDVLQRPLFERNYWPIHLSIIAASATYGSATLKSGSWLTTAPALEGSSFDYLIVEQLARTVMTDLLERSGAVPFWMQEFLIQWLTSSAMYRIYPTKSVHAFHAGRIDDFKCFVDGTPSCSSYFSADLPLVDWNSATLASTGSVKSLMLAIYLDAKLGADVVAKALGPWFSVIPSPDGMEAMLKGYAPSAADDIDAIFTTWVHGSDADAADTAAVRAELKDDDDDGLLLFEEQKLGTSDAGADPYLN
jgi:hypothetical protein